MAEYICKCGKSFTKNTSAAVTGYRDTADCTGCPYLLEYGPQKWDGSGFRLDVQGHECRATQVLIYRTALGGDLTGKNSLHIMSLDFDFLERVSCWIKQHYPGAELSGTFSRGNIRGTDYEAHGRYSQGIYCAQNKAGVAAKQALLAEFFDGHGHRRDLSGEAEKAKILNDIERGQTKRMDYIISKRTSDGRLYALRNGNFYFYDKTIPKWLPSSWLTQGYEKARGKEDFTKEDFMQCDPLELADEWELPCDVLEALEHSKSKAQPCQCATCTCTGCHEQCFGNCTDCGSPTTDCNSYQTDGQKIPFGNSAAETGTAPDGQQDANAAETASAGGGSCDNLSQLKHWTPGGGAWDDSESIAPPETEESEDKVCTQKSPKTAAPAAMPPSPKGQGSPADAGAAALSPCDAAPACSAAAFDYSGLDAQTVQDLQLAEREYKTGRKMAEIGLRRMADGVAIAHDALCGTVVHQVDNGKFAAKEDTFRRWCESIGIGKTTAYKLLNVAELFANSSPNQQKLLQELSPSLLYAAAKPSAPEEAVDLVKSGDIKTHKEYQQLLAQLKQAEKLRAELRQAKAALEGVNADSSVARERADRLAVELAESEAEIAQLKEQLAATPGVIDGHAIDTEELERRAEAMAKVKIEEENAKWTQMVEGLQKQVKQLQDGTDMPSKIGTAQALIDDILTGIEADLNWMPISQQKDLRIRCALDDLVQSLQEFADNFSKTDFGHGGEPDV